MTAGPPPTGAIPPAAWIIFALSVGGTLGVNARYWLGLFVARWLGTRFPWATVGINVTGSFAIGLVAMVLAERRWGDSLLRIFAITGFLGGYTTFSSYIFETIAFWERGDRRAALGNLLGSIALGLLAVVLGMMLGRWFAGPPTPSPAQEARVERQIEAISEAESGAEPSSA